MDKSAGFFFQAAMAGLGKYRLWLDLGPMLIYIVYMNVSVWFTFTFHMTEFYCYEHYMQKRANMIRRSVYAPCQNKHIVMHNIELHWPPVDAAVRYSV